MIKKILVIEDEPLILDLISSELRAFAFTVGEASCGKEGIKKLEAEEYDLIISDYRMPNGDGMSVLKFSQQLKKPPYFFFISGQSIISAEDCLLAGATRFIEKPFELEELVAEINKLNTL